jgi:hypothetical protein
MPNKHSDLVIKLFSIGLSLDISCLEQFKYSTSEPYNERKEGFKITYRRIFLALVSLGYIIENYSVRRLCFSAAKTCEEETQYCTEILHHLPECNTDDIDDHLSATLLGIRYQLEIFQRDIRINNILPRNFDKSSNAIYDTLEYFHHCAPMSSELRPLEYPGVEKYLKKQAFEDTDHISQVSDLDKCLQDYDVYNTALSSCFKKLGTFFKPAHLPLFNKPIPTNDEIRNKCKDILKTSNDFKLHDFNLYAEMFSIKLKSLFVDAKQPPIIKSEHNASNLYFDFRVGKKEDSCDEYDFDIDSMYQQGNIPIKMLYEKGLGSYDIENVLLYAIMEKKKQFTVGEFEFFNRNHNVEANDDQNQVYAGLLYFLNKSPPEYARLMRLTSTLMRFRNIMEYALDTYIMDATPGKFKYKQKHKIAKVKPSEVDADANSNQSREISTEVRDAINTEQLTLPEANKKHITVLLNNKVIKEKLPPAITLNGNETFNVAKNILNIFYKLKCELSNFVGRDVFLDLSKVSDASSANLISCLHPEESKLVIKTCRTRNGRLDPREKFVEVALPLLVNGKLTIVTEIRDEFEYDEFLEHPSFKTTVSYRFNGTLIVESLSHNVKFDLDCSVDNVVSKIKVIFQGVKSSKLRKKSAQKVDNSSSKPTQNGLQLSIATTVAALPFHQQTSNNPDTISRKISSEQQKKTVHSTISQLHSSSSYLLEFGAIMTAAYNQAQTHQITNALLSSSQYSSPTNDILQVPSEQLQHTASCTNGASYHNREEEFAHQPIHPISADSRDFSSKIALQKPKIENIKLERVSKKLSFGNPCVAVEEENTNGFMSAQVNNQLENIDFEDAMLLKSAVIPKKNNIQIPEVQSAHAKQLLLIPPPPLHYPSSELPISDIPKIAPIVFKCEQLAPPQSTKEKEPEKIITSVDAVVARTKVEVESEASSPTATHKLTSNVIMKKTSLHEINGNKSEQKSLSVKKTKIETIIDLTDDNSTDLIRKFETKNQRSFEESEILDIQFVSCESQSTDLITLIPPISTTVVQPKRRIINMKGRKIRAAKRSFSPGNKVRECKVHLIDIFRNFGQRPLKKNTRIKLYPRIAMANYVSFI